MAIEKDLYFIANSKSEYRKKIFDTVVLEDEGSGHHWYFVEKCTTGNRVYLTRPGQLNKGIDFVVNVEGTNFATDEINPQTNKKYNRRKNPKHADLVRILEQYKNHTNYQHIKIIISKLYACKQVTEEEYQQINISSDQGENQFIEHTLRAIKWLFIEQDITYWNGSGRKMLWETVLLENELV